jgi:hypothetical protein
VTLADISLRTLGTLKPPVLSCEVPIAIEKLKSCTSPGVDQIAAKMIQAGNELDVL